MKILFLALILAGHTLAWDFVLNAAKAGLCMDNNPMLHSNICLVGGYNCARGSDLNGVLCVERNANQILINASSQQRSEHIRQVALAKFEQLKQDQKFQNQCCLKARDQKDCKSKLEQTSFIIPAYDSARGVQSCYYDNGNVVCEQGFLNQVLNEEVLTSYITHELGHACHSYHQQWDVVINSNQCDEEERFRQQSRQLFGESFTSCVDGVFQATRQADVEKKLCMASWWRETISDTLFYQFRTRAEQWTYLCATGGQLHAASFLYGNCLPLLAGFKEMACGMAAE